MVGKLISFHSKQIAHADWRTDLHEDLIGRTDMIERMDVRIEIRIEYGSGITVRTRIDNGSDLDLKSLEEGNFWFRYCTFIDMKKDIRDFHVIDMIFSQYPLCVERNTSYDTRINSLHEITKFSKQIVGATTKRFISLSSFNVDVAWTPYDLELRSLADLFCSAH